MKEKSKYFPFKGFMLLPPSPVPSYRGVDRHPFQPALIETEMDSSIRLQEGESRIWVFYPAGWRRDAYRLYEENLVIGGDELFLLSNFEAAREIQRIIEPHIGSHEIAACEVWRLDSILSHEDVLEATLIGYDIAFAGGDFYSAILNGLFINPHLELVEEYKPLLNQYGLFSSMNPIAKYIHRFKELISSEADSEFCIFRLSIASGNTED